MPFTDYSHTVHTDDCMSDWGERGRDLMTPLTIACNHRLHLADVFDYVCTVADCGWASDDSTAVCPVHGSRVPTWVRRSRPGVQ
jgi:hypothetical protein